jgi:DNA repair exonuclease SbcCD ATPase subunit
VKKEVATNLESTIQEKDAIIIGLRRTIGEKEVEILKNQSYISQLTSYIQQRVNQIQDLSDKNKVLKDENWELNKYIENRDDHDVGLFLEQFRYEQEKFNAEKTGFNTFVEDQQKNLDALFIEADGKQTALEVREKHLAEREEKIQKREDELDSNRNTMYDALHKCINSVEIGFDKQKEEMNQEKKKITDQQEQIMKKEKVLKKIAEEQNTEAQRLQQLQTFLDKIEGFNKFSLPCPSCTKPMLFDATDQETRQKIHTIFGNYTHAECRQNEKQNAS